MKVLLVSPFTSASGSAIRFWNIAQMLARRGHAVVFVDRRAKEKVRHLYRCEGVRYYSCPSSGMLLPDIVFSFFYNCTVFARHLDCSLYYALKPAPNNCIPALIARLLGKKIILDVDDLDYAYLGNGAAREVFRRFFDFFPRFFQLVTFHTPHLETYLREHARVAPEHCHYLAQGVTPVFLDNGDGDGGTTGTTTLLYVATLGITSDFSLLIPGIRDVCTRYPSCTMSVVGDGCRKEEFKRMVSDAGLDGNVTFTGTIPHAQLPEFVRRHRIGINYMRPSTVNQCRAILKIREYLACGLHVVCNDVGDAELFREHITITASVDALFAAVAELIERNPAPNDAGRRFIERYYRWPDIIDAFCTRIATL